ncbi:MAG: hypothetical protein II075_02695 [Bacteroidales bacterium]|nr:hypothetical protein [Bacteroidales bacterium]
MKKIAKILAVSALGVLAACSNPGANQNNDTAQSQPQEQNAKAVDFPDVDIKEINDYLNEIELAGIQNFEPGKLNDEAMIDFAIKYLWDNSSNLFTASEECCDRYISEKEVEKVTLKFFDTKPSKHQTIDEFTVYENGQYKIPAADGEGISFCHVEKLIGKKGSTAEYALKFYSAGSGFNGDLDPATWGSPDEEDVPSYYADGKATLVYKNGKYYLSGWQKTPKNDD